jgi:hypothetical protein
MPKQIIDKNDFLTLFTKGVDSLTPEARRKLGLEDGKIIMFHAEDDDNYMPTFDDDEDWD